MRPTPSSVGLDASQPLRRTGGERPGLVLAIVLSLYLAIAVAWLWPVMADPAATRPDIKAQNSLILADYYLIVWALAWDSHALVTSPLHLFDANTFHPSPRSLAFSEHFLGMVPLFAPTYWATGNPILAANVLVLLTLVLSATAARSLTVESKPVRHRCVARRARRGRRRPVPAPAPRIG